jgi:AAA ATPase domain
MGLASWVVISRRVSPVLVGRDAELETLMGLLGEAVGGTPGTVLLGAEAGGGKSRLVAEFTVRVRVRVRDRALVRAGLPGTSRPSTRVLVMLIAAASTPWMCVSP